MKKILIFLLLFTAFYGFSQYLPYGHFYFTGTINGNLPIQMELIIEEDRAAHGSYYYENYGELISLENGIIEDFTVTVSEYSDGLRTGTFTGTVAYSEMDYAESFTGTWSSTNGRSYPFSLRRVASFISIELGTSRNFVNGYFPYFTEYGTKELNEFMDYELQQLVRFFNEGLRMYEENQLYYGWDASNYININYYSSNLISLESYYYEFTGGVHGNSFIHGRNFAYLNGSWIEINLVKLLREGSGYISFLSDFIMDDLREQGASSITLGIITELSREDLMSFTITPRGLEFIFSPYHVGSYAEGYYTVTVPFSDLAPYISTGSLLSRFPD